MHAAYMLRIGGKRTLFVFNKVAAAILIGGKSSSDSVILSSGSLDDRIDECTRDEMVIGILTIGMFLSLIHWNKREFYRNWNCCFLFDDRGECRSIRMNARGDDLYAL